MNLEKIQEEWAKDCVIDKIDMDKASLETPKLHSKYLDELSSKRLNYKKYEVEYNKLLQLRRERVKYFHDNDMVWKAGSKQLVDTIAPKDK